MIILFIVVVIWALGIEEEEHQDEFERFRRGKKGEIECQNA